MELAQQEAVDLQNSLQQQYNAAIRNGNMWEAKDVLKRAYGKVVIDLNQEVYVRPILWEYENHGRE